jgi:Uma2 family endonuclease
MISAPTEEEMAIVLDADDPDVIDGIYYPSEDGKSMAQTVYHVDTAVDLAVDLRDQFYHGRNDIFVSLDNYWYWEQGNPKACAVPDIMVCFGVNRETLVRSYMEWRQNNVGPSVCFEFLSRGTWKKNLTVTKDLYERRGVSEYFVVDPDYKYLKTGVKGFRLKKGKYVDIVPEADGSMLAKSLNFRLLLVGRTFKLLDPKTGKPVPTSDQRTLAKAEKKAQKAVREANERARLAEEQARQAKEEIERLRAQLHGKNSRTNGAHSS